MQLLSKKITVTLAALSIVMPVMNAQGMSYLPSRWFAKTPKAAEEAVKKEAAKVAEKVVEKTTTGQYAAQNALVVAKVAGKTVVGVIDLAEFALGHPKILLATAAGASIYIYRDQIKEKIKEYKPQLLVAGGIAVITGMIPGKKLIDLCKKYGSILGLTTQMTQSQSVLQQANLLPTIKFPERKRRKSCCPRLI